MFSVSRLVFRRSTSSSFRKGENEPFGWFHAKNDKAFPRSIALGCATCEAYSSKHCGPAPPGDAVAVSRQLSECVRVVAALEGRAAMESDAKTHRPPKALRAKLTGDAWFRQLPGEVPLTYFLDPPGAITF